MKMQSIKICSVWVIVGLVLSLVPGNAGAEDKWFVNLYGAQLSEDALVESFTADYVDAYLVALALGKEIWNYKDALCLEAEGQIVKHWGKQEHMEFNALFALRWLRFPWDQVIDTSFAVGEGLSYATEDPVIEAEKMDNPSKLLNYLMFEWALSVPSHPDWHIIIRVHHRSGIYGLFNGVDGGSNAAGAGVRYDF